MRPTRLLPILAVIVAVLIGPVAGHAHAGGGGGAICDGFSQGDEITMLDNCYAGTAHFIDPDASVLDITNQGQLPHTYTAIDGAFDLYLEPGETGTVDLPDALVTPVYCTLHGTSRGQGMSGVVIRTSTDVLAASATGTPAPQSDAALGVGTDSAPADDGNESLSVIALVVASAAAALSLATAAHLIASRRRASEGR